MSRRHDEMRLKLESVLGDKLKFLKSARSSFRQFDYDNSGTLSFDECRALIDRLIFNLSLPPIDDHTLKLIFTRFNTSENDEMSADDFAAMFWQILWRVRDKYYPAKDLAVRRAAFIGRNVIGDKQIKKYFSFEKKLGNGSFGEVHLVVERSSGLERCCKVIAKDRVGLPAEQFETEISTLKRLDHPNVIKIIDVYEDLYNLYLVQDLCTGGELFKRVSQASDRAKVLTERYVREITEQILKALAYIHESNIVHKDLKPENILFADRTVHSEIKVIDFGLAEMFKSPDDVSRNAAGTILYMAPEVFNKKITTKCDVWSTGVIVFFLLTGRHPFVGRTQVEVKTKVLNSEPPFSGYCRHLSAEAIDFVTLLLRKNPRERPSAKEALMHPWFHIRAKDDAFDPVVVQNLVNYSKNSNLKAAMINLMAHQLNFNSTQIRNVAQTFRKLDRDNSGTLSRDELMEGLEAAGCSKWEVHKIVSALDVDGSGDISYTEFLAAAYSWRESELNIIWTAFSKLDKDHDGKITVDEFAEVLRGDEESNKALTGDPSSSLVSREQIVEVLSQVDRNGDGVIEWQEFLAYMKQ